MSHTCKKYKQKFETDTTKKTRHLTTIHHEKKQHADNLRKKQNK